MTEWFYVRDGQQFGPVAFEQLVALARSGGLTGRDSVWNASMTGWTPAGQVPGIFDLYTGPSAPPASAPIAPTAANTSSVSNASSSSNPYAAPQSDWSKPFAAGSPALTEIAPGSEPIDPMECLSRGYEIFKREFANILLVGLVYFACIMGVSFIFNIFQALTTGVASRGSGSTTDPGSVVLIVAVLGQVVIQVISIFLKLGLTRVGLNLVSGKEVSIGMLFGEGSKLLRVIGASILFGCAVLIGFLLLIVPGIYIILRYGQFMTAIVDRDLGIFEAFSYSESITTDNRTNLFILGLLSFLAMIVGMLMCLVGMIVAGPLVWLAALVAYRWMQYGAEAAKDHPGTQIPMLNSV